MTNWRNETAADVAWGNWDADERRGALRAMTELHRAHPTYREDGTIRGDQEDAHE